MQRSIAEWLTASRGRALAGGLGLAVFGALLLPFSSWLPGALIVLVTLLGRPVPDPAQGQSPSTWIPRSV